LHLILELQSRTLQWTISYHLSHPAAYQYQFRPTRARRGLVGVVSNACISATNTRDVAKYRRRLRLRSTREYF